MTARLILLGDDEAEHEVTTREHRGRGRSDIGIRSSRRREESGQVGMGLLSWKGKRKKAKAKSASTPRSGGGSVVEPFSVPGQTSGGGTFGIPVASLCGVLVSRVVPPLLFAMASKCGR